MAGGLARGATEGVRSRKVRTKLRALIHAYVVTGERARRRAHDGPVCAPLVGGRVNRHVHAYLSSRPCESDSICLRGRSSCWFSTKAYGVTERLSEQIDCDRTVIRQAQNLDEHR